jgi:hypothetical protein
MASTTDKSTGRVQEAVGGITDNDHLKREKQTDQRVGQGKETAERALVESAAIWNLHLIYRLSQTPERFDAVVRGKVCALEGVTSVALAPSHDASTRLTFSTCYSNVIVAAVAAKQCLHNAVNEHNAKGWWWQRKVRLVDEPAVQKVA